MDKRCFATVRRHSFGACVPLALGVALAVSSAAGVARAQSAPESTPPTHEKRAQVAYALQDWPTAIREFEAAFQGEQRPDFLWGIAQAQRLSGDCKSAINTYKSYRRAEITAEQSEAAESRIQHCEDDLKKQAATAQPSPAQPLANPQSAAPPAAAPAKATESTLAPAPLPAAHRPFYSDPLGDVLVLTGVAAAGIGTYFLISGNSAMSDAKTASYGSFDSDTHHASQKQLVGVATLAGGGLLAVCGVVRFLTLGDSSTGPGTALTLSPTGFDLRGRF